MVTDANIKFSEGLKHAIGGKGKSRAFIGSLIVGKPNVTYNACPSLAGSETSSTSSGSNNSSRTGTPSSIASYGFADVERCSCCTIDDFWKIYDSFVLMDKRACGSVRRGDFYEAISEHVTVDMRRTMVMADLQSRFRSSATEMTLAELLGRVWPMITDGDRKMMMNWAKLRDASAILKASSFQGTREDLKRIFDFLEAANPQVSGSQSLSMGELVRARILTKDESQKLLQDWYASFSKQSSDSECGCKNANSDSLNLSFNEFCLMTQDHLSEKYVQKENSCPWVANFRSAFQASKAATVKFNAARDGYNLAYDNLAAPEKMNLKSGVGMKAAYAPCGFGGNGIQNRGSIMVAC